MIAIGRDTGKLAALPEAAERRLADLGDPVALRLALADARRIAVCANAQFLPAVLAALPAAGVERLVAMGSTRAFSAVPDATGAAVRAAEASLKALPIPSVLLLATLIYGAGTGVVDQLAGLIRRFPLLPLPGGGRALVQPIHIEDVALALEAALFRPEAPGRPIVIAGPEAMSYRRMAERIAAARGLKLRILPVPGWPLTLAARLLGQGRLAGPSAALRRLLEDKAFVVDEMRDRLGLVAREFDPGLG